MAAGNCKPSTSRLQYFPVCGYTDHRIKSAPKLAKEGNFTLQTEARVGPKAASATRSSWKRVRVWVDVCRVLRNHG